MAIAHLRVTAQSRGQGASAIAKAAYNSGSKLQDLDGSLHAYDRKGGVKFRQLVFNPKISGGHESRQEFWRNVEKSEKRKDACLSREFCTSLPVELSYEQNLKLTQEWSNFLINRYNLRALDVAVHYPSSYKTQSGKTKDAWRPWSKSKSENPHIHALAPDRDREGKKINLSRNRNEILILRDAWEKICNKHLEAAGIDERISMKSSKTQIHELSEDIKSLEKREMQIKAELIAVKTESESQKKKEVREMNAEEAKQWRIMYNLAKYGASKEIKETFRKLEGNTLFQQKSNMDEFAERINVDLQKLAESKYQDAEIYNRIHKTAKDYLTALESIEAKQNTAKTESRRRRIAGASDAERVEIMLSAAPDGKTKKLIEEAQSKPGYNGAEMYRRVKDDINKIMDCISEGGREKEAIKTYEQMNQKLTEYKIEASLDATQITSMDETIYKRHAQKAAQIAAERPEKIPNLIALRLRGTGHREDAAMRIMAAGGMDARDAARAVAEMYHTANGDRTLETAQKYIDQWRREERGEVRRPNHMQQPAAQNTNRPAQQHSHSQRM